MAMCGKHEHTKGFAGGHAFIAKSIFHAILRRTISVV